MTGEYGFPPSLREPLDLGLVHPVPDGSLGSEILLKGLKFGVTRKGKLTLSLKLSFRFSPDPSLSSHIGKDVFPLAHRLFSRLGLNLPVKFLGEPFVSGLLSKYASERKRSLDLKFSLPRGDSSSLERLFQCYASPSLEELVEVLEEGVSGARLEEASGNVDPFSSHASLAVLRLPIPGESHVVFSTSSGYLPPGHSSPLPKGTWFEDTWKAFVDAFPKLPDSSSSAAKEKYLFSLYLAVLVHPSSLLRDLFSLLKASFSHLPLRCRSAGLGARWALDLPRKGVPVRLSLIPAFILGQDHTLQVFAPDREATLSLDADTFFLEEGSLLRLALQEPSLFLPLKDSSPPDSFPIDASFRGCWSLVPWDQNQSSSVLSKLKELFGRAFTDLETFFALLALSLNPGYSFAAKPGDREYLGRLLLSLPSDRERARLLDFLLFFLSSRPPRYDRVCVEGKPLSPLSQLLTDSPEHFPLERLSQRLLEEKYPSLLSPFRFLLSSPRVGFVERECYHSGRTSRERPTTRLIWTAGVRYSLPLGPRLVPKVSLLLHKVS